MLGSKVIFSIDNIIYIKVHWEQNCAVMGNPEEVECVIVLKPFFVDRIIYKIYPAAKQDTQHQVSLKALCK